MRTSSWCSEKFNQSIIYLLELVRVLVSVALAALAARTPGTAVFVAVDAPSTAATLFATQAVAVGHSSQPVQLAPTPTFRRSVAPIPDAISHPSAETTHLSLDSTDLQFLQQVKSCTSHLT